MNNSIERIHAAKDELRMEGIRITQRSIADYSGLSIITVKRHFNKVLINLDEELARLNEIKVAA